MNSFLIEDRMISEDHPPFIIAEAGINHEGEYEKAIQLIDAAVKSGADCIKFQCHITEAEMILTDMKPGKISDESLWNIIKRCELTEEEEYKLKKYCEQKGIMYLCTPFSREASDRLENMGVVAFKIGSGECNNLPLIKHIAQKKKPIILSTGMNDIESIQASVDTIRENDCPFMLMHCTSAYPTPYEYVRLGVIQELNNVFNVPVGLSDHSIGIYTCFGAVALGARVLEKHFTISRQWPGPDNPISIEPDELADLVKGANAIFQARNGTKRILQIEKPVIDFAYASIVTIKNVKKGEVFSLENIWVKRPGTGSLLAKDLDDVLGKTSQRDLSAGTQINPDDFV